ncbi:MAG TPA: hypothetical protein PKA51_14000 [Kiritimatiellia bacterium]|nr:hypothetical protein [Kiritimatiellia bacterium]
MTRRFIPGVMACWLCLVSAASFVQAAGIYDIASMPFTITAPGHYRLVSSIQATAGNTNPVITVNAPMGGVLIDLNGHTIGGVSNRAPAIFIPSGHPDVTIQNGFIVNVRHAPAIHAQVVNVAIRDITFFGCDNPVQAASRTVIEGCLAWNGDGGISTNGVLVAAGDSVIRDCAITDFRLGGSSGVSVGERSRMEGVVLREVVHASGTAHALRASSNSVIDRVSIVPINGNLNPLAGNPGLRAFVAHGNTFNALTGHSATESVLWGGSKFASFAQVTHSITYGGASASPGFQDCENLFGVIAAGHTNIGSLEAAFNKQDGPWMVRRSLSHRNHWRDARLLTSHKSFSENLLSTFNAADIFHNDADLFNQYHAVRDNHLVGAGAEITTASSWVEGNSLSLTTGTNATVSGATPITNPGNNFITDQPRANFVIY